MDTRGHSITEAHRLMSNYQSHGTITDEQFLWLRDQMGYRNIPILTTAIRCTHNSAHGILYGRIAVSTLRHLAQINRPISIFAVEELGRRGIPVDVNEMVVGFHAIDQCSKRYLTRWMNDSEGGCLAGIGLASWLANEAKQAYDDGVKDESGGRYVRNGMTFCIGVNRDQLKLQTVI